MPKAFLAEGAGVVGAARTPLPGDESDRLLWVQADLTTPLGAQNAVEESLHQAKRIDALVHVMGGFAGGQSVADTDDETWEKMMDLNLRAAFYVVRAVLPPMVEAGYGRIVAVGSRVGVEPVATLSAYGVSKAGLHALIQAVAKEVGDKGITANVVLPSVIDTPANRKAMPKADPSRWVTPEAIAQQILNLCRDSASDVNGALIPIYGRA